MFDLATYLSRDHPADPGCIADAPGCVCQLHSMIDNPLDQQLKAKIEEGIPGKNSGRFIECLMAGWLSTPQVVIIHGREVIMDQ